jgi:3,4-dihydroxy 2-butanone 4-phosphate synthase
MSQPSFNAFPSRLRAVLRALHQGRPILLFDDDDRENEADLIVAAERIDPGTMAMLIREGSGIVCLCLPDEAAAAAVAAHGVAQREPLRHGLHRFDRGA